MNRPTIHVAGLLVLPIFICLIVWKSTEEAPARFHLLALLPYGLTTIAGIILCLFRRRFLLPTITMHGFWFFVYAVTAIIQLIHLNSVSEYPGDSRLSGLIWVTIYFAYAIIVPLAAILIWCFTGSRRSRSPEKPDRIG